SVLTLLRPPPRSSLFPYTTLFRSARLHVADIADRHDSDQALLAVDHRQAAQLHVAHVLGHMLDRLVLEAVFHVRAHDVAHLGIRDRKSTRLNSSHVKISYAVFCLK